MQLDKQNGDIPNKKARIERLMEDHLPKDNDSKIISNPLLAKSPKICEDEEMAMSMFEDDVTSKSSESALEPCFEDPVQNADTIVEKTSIVFGSKLAKELEEYLKIKKWLETDDPNVIKKYYGFDPDPHKLTDEESNGKSAFTFLLCYRIGVDTLVCCKKYFPNTG